MPLRVAHLNQLMEQLICVAVVVLSHLVHVRLPDELEHTHSTAYVPRGVPGLETDQLTWVREEE